MPTMKYSALDPSGTWQQDAMDQVEQWNANRGDQWSRFALDMSQRERDRAAQQAQEDWRKEVALKQLGLQENMWKGGREDSAAERAAKYGFAEKELGYRQGESAAERALRERMLAMQETDPSRQASAYALQRMQKRDQDAEQFATQFDPSAYGFTDPRASAALKSLVAMGGASSAAPLLGNILERSIREQNRPMDRREMGEDARGKVALEIIAKYQGRQDLTPREMQEYTMAVAEAEKQGYGGGFGIAPTGQSEGEFAKQQIRAIAEKADQLAGGVTGVATDDDVKALAQDVEDLRSTMQKERYDARQIEAVILQLKQKIAEIAAPTWKRAVLAGPAALFGMGGGFSQQDMSKIAGE